MSKGKIYLVGLPIGNYGDLSPRAKEYITTAKNIVIEREEAFEHVWKRLGITRPNVNIIPIEYDSDGGEPGFAYELENSNKILELLENGEDVYIVSDEGMPGIADPGEFIVRAAIKRGIEITATPGPSVVIAAVSVAGCMHNFLFDAFLPYEEEEIEKFISSRRSVHVPIVIVLRNLRRNPSGFGPAIFHDEIPKFLEKAENILGKDRQAVLCYNLTTNNERVIRGTLEYLRKYFEETPRDESQITIVIDSHNGPLWRIYNDTLKQD
jgi:16S rRNA (cytidine1402-2'-O)-methyltransferase